LWRSRILRFFQNARSRRDNNLQVVVARKKAPGTVRPKAPVQVKSVALFGIVNFLLERQPGDTDDTISDMMKILCDEGRRIKRNHSRIEQLMTQPFLHKCFKFVNFVFSIYVLDYCDSADARIF